MIRALTAGLLLASCGLASAASNDSYPRAAYPVRPSRSAAAGQGHTVDPWGFFNRECTSYVAWRINHDAGYTEAPWYFYNTMRRGIYTMEAWGDALNWNNRAPLLGWAVNGSPEAGAIAHWDADEGFGPYGHVAIVEAVNPDGSVVLTDYNRFGDHQLFSDTQARPPRFIHVPRPIPPAPAHSGESFADGLNRPDGSPHQNGWFAWEPANALVIANESYGLARGSEYGEISRTFGVGSAGIEIDADITEMRVRDGDVHDWELGVFVGDNGNPAVRTGITMSFTNVPGRVDEIRYIGAGITQVISYHYQMPNSAPMHLKVTFTTEPRLSVEVTAPSGQAGSSAGLQMSLLAGDAITVSLRQRAGTSFAPGLDAFRCFRLPSAAPSAITSLYSVELPETARLWQESQDFIRSYSQKISPDIAGTLAPGVVELGPTLDQDHARFLPSSAAAAASTMQEAARNLTIALSFWDPVGTRPHTDPTHAGLALSSLFWSETGVNEHMPELLTEWTAHIERQPWAAIHPAAGYLAQMPVATRYHAAQLVNPGSTPSGAPYSFGPPLFTFAPAPAHDTGSAGTDQAITEAAASAFDAFRYLQNSDGYFVYYAEYRDHPAGGSSLRAMAAWISALLRHDRALQHGREALWNLKTSLTNGAIADFAPDRAKLVAYQESLRTTGMPGDLAYLMEKAGLTAGEVENLRQRIISLDPTSWTLSLYDSLNLLRHALGTLSAGPEQALLNSSMRGVVLPDTSPLIHGFVVQGRARKRVLIRAVGPTLGAAPFSLPGTAYDPMLALHTGSGLLTTNDNWDSPETHAALVDAMRRTGAFSLAAGSRDAALLLDLEPGPYTAVVTSRPGEGGIALVESYLVDDQAAPAASVVNSSSRAWVGSGDALSILGFVTDGTASRRYLIRAVGPTLGQAPFNLNGALADPHLAIYRQGLATPVAGNEDWGDGNEAAALAAAARLVGAFPLAAGSKDAALLIELPPNSVHTVHVTHADGTEGVALAEVYQLP